MPDRILSIRKLVTSEDHEDQMELGRLRMADNYASEIVVGGVLLTDDAKQARLVTAVDLVSEKEFCGCRNCEHARAVDAIRNESSFYIGLAAGLRMARATERDNAVVADAGGAA